LLAQNIGIALACLGKLNNLTADGLSDGIVTVAGPQSNAVISTATARDPRSLWLEPLTIEQWGDRHGALLFSGGSATGLSATADRIDHWILGTSFLVPLKARSILPAIGGLRLQQSGKLWGTNTMPLRLRSRPISLR
jgi:hypothetical protein